jgi:small subunit ribosomal protein S4
MGDPRKIRRKYSKPYHPWERIRIEEERGIFKKYGLANKAEIWKMDAFLSSVKDQAKNLIASQSHQSKTELELLIRKLQNLGLLKEEASTDTILGLTINDVMERRLETLVYKNRLARTMKQARQFILHGHVAVSGKKITSPSYMVSVSEQANIHFLAGSTIASIDHPERLQEKEIKELENELHNLNLKHGSENGDAGRKTDRQGRPQHKVQRGGRGKQNDRGGRGRTGKK